MKRTNIVLFPIRVSRGFGREAMFLLEKTARDHGAKVIHLLVRPDNIAALRISRGAGFEAPGRLFLTKSIGADSE